MMHHPLPADDHAGRLIRRASLFSLVTGVFLVSIKAVAWSFTDSLSMMSSLADSMLDVIASTINFVAVRYALQPPDHEHRFGHGKAEDLATLAQSTFICGSGIFLIIEGIRRVFSPAPIYDGMTGIIVMVISVICTLALVRYQRHVIRQTKSGPITADAFHYFTDFLSNIGVIISIILAFWFGWRIADPLFAILIAGGLIWGSFHLGMTALNALMDREFSDEEREQIKHIVRAHQDVMNLHELRTRKAGVKSFIQFHLDLDENLSLRQAHDISNQVEASLQHAFPNAEILIHQDPRPSEVSGVRSPEFGVQ